MISGAATHFDVKGVIWQVLEHLEALYGFLFPKKTVPWEETAALRP